MTPDLAFMPLAPDDLLRIEPQESQATQCGIPPGEMSPEEAASLAGQENAWAVRRGATVLACLGITETYRGAQGVAWALISRHVGRAIVPITQFARDAVIGTSELGRLEAIVRCADLPEWLAAERLPAVRQGIALEWALQRPTPQVRWAMKVGLQPAAVLRRFGAAGEAHMLMERVLA